MTTFPLSQIDALKQGLQDKGVKYAMASYVDMHGVIKGKFVPLAHLGQMLRGSELYTGAALAGVKRVEAKLVSAKDVWQAYIESQQGWCWK